MAELALSSANFSKTPATPCSAKGALGDSSLSFRAPQRQNSGGFADAETEDAIKRQGNAHRQVGFSLSLKDKLKHQDGLKVSLLTLLDALWFF